MRPGRASSCGTSLGISALLLLSLLVLSPQGASAASQPSGLTPSEKGALTIDKGLFAATVPSFAYVGQNISVVLRITNRSNETLPIIVGLSVPVDILYVSPLLIHQTIQPHGQLTDTFFVVVIQQSSQGAVNVTAKIWVWFLDRMNGPELVFQTSTELYNIGPSAQAGVIVGAAALIVAAVLLAWRYRRRVDVPRLLRRVLPRRVGGGKAPPGPEPG